MPIAVDELRTDVSTITRLSEEPITARSSFLEMLWSHAREFRGWRPAERFSSIAEQSPPSFVEMLLSRASEMKEWLQAEQFESQYQKIGWWDGPEGTPAARELIRRFWTSTGQPGAQWLAHRLNAEYHSDVLDAAGSILADIGPVAIPYILAELNGQPPWGQAEALLNALGWMPQKSSADLVRTIRRYLRHEDAELREAGIRATSILPRREAIELLHEAMGAETDKEVHDALTDRISDRMAG